MTRDDFNALATEAKGRSPSWFDQVERPVHADQVAALERTLEVTLPNDFRAFLLDHGAGYFGAAIILSADQSSDWYIPARGRHAFISRGFVAISDDEAGGFYGFECQSGVCGKAVFYWYPDEIDEPKQVAASFYDWAAENAPP